MTCKVCKNSIGVERLEALPNTLFCVKCAIVHGSKPRKGIMIYDNELCGELMTMSAEKFESRRDYFNPMSDINFIKVG